MRTVTLGILLSVSVVTVAAAANIRSSVSSKGNTILFLDGEIQIGDASAVENLIRSANQTNRLVTAIRLNSPGGNLLEGAKLADLIRYGKIATVVPAASQCASACFLVFAAGVEKFASYNSNVGVHGASDQSGNESGDATVSMGRAAKDLGVPANIIGKMVVTPPNEVVWLSPDDLRSMGVAVTGKPSQLPTAQQIMPQTPPTQLDPSAKANAPGKSPTWGELVDKAFALSQQQNGGKPFVNRLCEPELKLCSTAVFLKDRDGNTMMVRSAEDPAGNKVRRDACTFNSFGDVRTCVDWDSQVVTREMKDANGHWYGIGDN
jgi:ATP-dependent protease ClpP protease subunit